MMACPFAAFSMSINLLFDACRCYCGSYGFVIVYLMLKIYLRVFSIHNFQLNNTTEDGFERERIKKKRRRKKWNNRT